MSSFQRDEELCKHYAQFASHMVRWQFKIIYWSMFVTNLIFLFLASWTFCKAQEDQERFSHDPYKRKRSLRKYILLCLGCVGTSTVIVVMEVYALLALQFCDGEDLMSLYWSTWTMIQVGSLIAMIGIILAMCHSLSNRTHPPWALALGTPVLVIAGFLHLFHDCASKRVKKSLAKRKSADLNNEMGPPMSQVNTIQVPDDDDETVKGELIGMTIEGGPIVRFTHPQGPLPDHAELLGHCEDQRPLIAYRKDSIRFLPADDAEKRDLSPTTSRTS